MSERQEGAVSHEAIMMRIDVLDIRLREHIAAFERVRHNIYGDESGKPGIDERLRNIERDISRISGAISKVGWPLVVAAALGSGTLLWGAVKSAL